MHLLRRRRVRPFPPPLAEFGRLRPGISRPLRCRSESNALFGSRTLRVILCADYALFITSHAAGASALEGINVRSRFRKCLILERSLFTPIRGGQTHQKEFNRSEIACAIGARACVCLCNRRANDVKERFGRELDS